jgi:hypothetical protein
VPSLHLNTNSRELTHDPIRQLLDELEANRRSRRTAWATLQRLRKFLEANGARIPVPEDRTFETEGEAIESGLRRTVEERLEPLHLLEILTHVRSARIFPSGCKGS